MPNRCVVTRCRGQPRFGIPRDPELRQKWLEVIRRESFASSNRICDAHFKPDDIRRDSLASQYSAYEVSKLSGSQIGRGKYWLEILLVHLGLVYVLDVIITCDSRSLLSFRCCIILSYICKVFV